MKSGLQKQVLNLYRRLLRTASEQTVPTVRHNLKQFIRKEFKSKANEINSKDISSIEHQIRFGERRLEFFEEHFNLKKFSF
jgi:hypothetical protein